MGFLLGLRVVPILKLLVIVGTIYFELLLVLYNGYLYILCCVVGYLIMVLSTRHVLTGNYMMYDVYFRTSCVIVVLSNFELLV